MFKILLQQTANLFQKSAKCFANYPYLEPLTVIALAATVLLWFWR